MDYNAVKYVGQFITTAVSTTNPVNATGYHSREPRPCGSGRNLELAICVWRLIHELADKDHRTRDCRQSISRSWSIGPLSGSKYSVNLLVVRFPSHVSYN
jgi:hypothetical protein